MAHKSYTFHVHGMHCQSCVFLTESELSEHPQVAMVKSNLMTRTVDIAGDFGDLQLEHLMKELSQLLQKHGYKLALEPEQRKVNWNEFAVAFPMAGLFLFGFYLLQRLGVVNLVSSDSITFGTAFFIGIIASLSTCMAVVGGLVLSLSATYAHEGQRIKPQMLFHGGRIIAFFLLGGALGVLGSALQLGPTSMFLMSFIVALVMLILGLNLLDLVPLTKHLQLRMPRFISKQLLQVEAPLLMGAVTFFLPCGFTQSLQVVALSTGNFLQGGLTMLSFALGTFPVLGLLSLSSTTISTGRHAGIFYKTAGLIVVFFGVMNLLNSFVSIGLLNPIFNF